MPLTTTLCFLSQLSSCGLWPFLIFLVFNLESSLNWPFLANIVVLLATNEQKCNNWFEVAQSRYRLETCKGPSSYNVHEFFWIVTPPPLSVAVMLSLSVLLVLKLGQFFNPSSFSVLTSFMDGPQALRPHSWSLN